MLGPNAICFIRLAIPVSSQTQYTPNRSQYVNVYYWPESPGNTTRLCMNPQTTSLPDISEMYDPNTSHAGPANLTLYSQSPSIYVVFPSIYVADGCSTIGKTFTGLTASFAPGQLSTIGHSSSTYSFNFGDLPCPPANAGWDPSEGPYSPIVAPPEFLFNLDPAFNTCIPAASQGNDPFKMLRHAPTGSGPGNPFCIPGHCEPPNKRAVEHARSVPWAPRKTTAPGS